MREGSFAGHANIYLTTKPLEIFGEDRNGSRPWVHDLISQEDEVWKKSCSGFTLLSLCSYLEGRFDPPNITEFVRENFFHSRISSWRCDWHSHNFVAKEKPDSPLISFKPSEDQLAVAVR